MAVLKYLIAVIAAAAIFVGAAAADSISIPSLDGGDTAAADDNKRPPKCIFIWGSKLPKFESKVPGSVVVETAPNRYSTEIERLARSGGVMPMVIATVETDGKKTEIEMKNVSVQSFRIIGESAEENDVLQQEWSLTYETIQRVM